MVVHSAVFMLIFATANGAILTGGAVAPGDDRPGFLVSIAGAGAKRSAPPSPEAQLEAMLARQRQVPSPIVVEQQQAKPRANLDDLFGAETNARSTSSAGDGKATQDRAGNGAGASENHDPDGGTRNARDAAHPAPNHGAAASSGALWGQIEPCWRKLPNSSSVPVTLEIALSGEGLIALPPKIVRPTAEPPSERRLMAEARALAAISACVPYKGPALATAGQVIRVDFAKSK